MSALRRVGPRLAAPFRSSPAAAPGLAAIAAFVVLAAAEGGFYARSWYPAAVFVLGLLLVALLTVATRARIPRAVLIAAAGLGAYAAWSYLSITWAAQKGEAWDGANTAAMYGLVFALFALWPLRGQPAALLLGLLAVAVAVLGSVELLRIDPEREPGYAIVDGRFTAPVGYPNGNVALWTLALFPCLALGSRREVAAPLRPLLLACAVLVGGFALLGQSRGWFFTIPAALLAYVLLSHGARIRAALAVGVVGVAVAAVGRPLLDVRDGAETSAAALDAALADATRALFTAAALVALVGAAWALFDRRVRVPQAGARAGGAFMATAAVLAALAGLVVFNAREGSPVTALGDAWDEFKTGPQPSGDDDRFTGSLGSNRYDFWRVSWDLFTEQPVRGIGIENFQQEYLVRGESSERPRHPHSLPLRVLAQTGLIGALLLAGALGAALAAALAAIWRRRGLAALTAAAGTATFVYWFLHGALDWFWELPGLGAIAFALLGMAAGLAPRRPRRSSDPATPRPLLATPRARAAGVALVAIVGVGLFLPWVAELRISRAADIWTADPAGALDQLSRASAANPLASRPRLVEGVIASRLELPARARSAFEDALERDPRNSYAMLQLGILEWEAGRNESALRLLRRTREVDPRYRVAEDVLARMRRGELLDVNEVNREIRERANQRVRPR